MLVRALGQKDLYEYLEPGDGFALKAPCIDLWQVVLCNLENIDLQAEPSSASFSSMTRGSFEGMNTLT